MRRAVVRPAILFGLVCLLDAGATAVTAAPTPATQEARTAAEALPLPAAVPRTDPTYWFLTEAEIQAPRGGVQDQSRGLAVFTSGNLVQPLVDGEEMMRALRDDLAATRSGDFIHFTGWCMDRRVCLVPTADASSPDTVANLWASAIGRGVVSRTLLWDAPWSPWTERERAQNRCTQRLLHDAGGQAALDARLPALGAHHQKTAIVQRDAEAVAYCGGIDLAEDRWDTRQHESDPRRVREHWRGWHDAHVRVRGPAVLDIELNFRQRWNDRQQPRLAARTRPLITAPLPPVSTDPGTHHVQILRTYASEDGRYPGFAPRGEFTCLAAYGKAIGRAERYVYMETPFLVSHKIARELAAVLERIEALVIVVPQHGPDPTGSLNWHENRFIKILRATHPDKVHVYHLVQPATGKPVNVHAKVLIIDDVYAVIGSQNINRRSMTYDTEVAVAVVDADVVNGTCRFARDLRLNLWGEHLSLATTDAKIADPIAGVAEWERQAAAGTYRARNHTTPRPRRELSCVWGAFMDPSGRGR